MVIAIGGASRSGKSTLAEYLAKHLPDTVRIAQDDYAKPIRELPLIGDNPDWEHPDGILFDKMYDDIVRQRKNHHYVIAEGFLIFAKPKLKSLFDFSIFVFVDQDTFYQRKKEDFRWGQITDEYIEHIWQSYLKFGQVDMSKVDVKVDGKNLKSPLINEITDKIRLRS